MAPKARGELLARVNFPPYAVKMLTPRHLLVAGGGGKTKSGIANAVEIYELSFNGSHCCARPASRYSLGDNACMNCTTWFNGKYHVLAAGLDGDCQLYRVQYSVQEPGDVHHDDAVAGEDGETRDGSQPRRRRRQSSQSSEKGGGSGNGRRQSLRSSAAAAATLDKSSSPEAAAKDVSDQNSNSVLNQIGFEFLPGARFRTDFPVKEEPFQKVVRVSLDGRHLVTGGSDGHVRIWTYPDMKLHKDIEAHANEVDDLDIHPVGNKIVSVSRDGHSYVWSLKDGKQLCELKWDPPNGQKYRNRNCRFGITEQDKTRSKLFSVHVPARMQKNAPPCYLIKWDASKFISEKVQSVVKDVSSLAVSDDGRFIAVGSMSGSISIYIAFSLQRVYHVSEAHSIFVTGLEFVPSSEDNLQIVGDRDVSLISISVDNQIKMHSIPKPATISIWVFVVVMIVLLFLTFTLLNYVGL